MSERERESSEMARNVSRAEDWRIAAENGAGRRAAVDTWAVRTMPGAGGTHVAERQP
jgi:hypothetical protein